MSSMELTRKSVLEGLCGFLLNTYSPPEEIDFYEPVKDAIAYLTEQAPRTMTLDEVLACGEDDVVFLQTYVSKAAKPAIYQPDNSDNVWCCIVSTRSKSGLYARTDYGYGWICWTAMPSNEQMEAITWTR